MSLSRIKPNILLTIHPRPCAFTQFRCIRTKPTHSRRPVPPLQGAFGLPGDIGKKVTERVKRLRFTRKPKEDPNKIPLVPKEPGEKIETGKPWLRPMAEMSEQEIATAKRLEDQDKRIKEFELEKKKKTKEEIEREMYERETGRKIPVAEQKEEEEKAEKADTEVYQRDIIGRKFKKPKKKYNLDLWPTKNYVRFTNRPENKMRMAQAAAEIIQAYHQNMHGDKLGDLLNGPESAALQLPEGVVLRDVDTRHLTLPFPPSAILPTMRMIFSEMGDRVRFALSDQQVNSISTGIDFIKHLINPPRRVTNPARIPQLYTELVKIPFPVNVVILPDKKLEIRKLEKEEAARVRSIQAERAKEREAMLKAERAKAEAEKLAAEKAREEEEEEELKKEEEKRLAAEHEERLLREEREKAIAEEEKRKDRFHNFYGRVS